MNAELSARRIRRPAPWPSATWTATVGSTSWWATRPAAERGSTAIGGDASFEEPREIGDPDDNIYSLAVADLDGDGAPDVVVGNAGTPGAVLTNDGSGARFTLTRFGDGQGALYGLAVGDVNGDGILDLAAGPLERPEHPLPRRAPPLIRFTRRVAPSSPYQSAGATDRAPINPPV